MTSTGAKTKLPASGRTVISQSPHTKSHFHAIVHVAEDAHKFVDSIHSKTENANKAFKFAAGQRAFRNYSWIKAAPVLNKSGNLRGIVISTRAKTAFNFLVKTGEGLEIAGKALLIAGLAIEVAKSTDRIESIIHSNESAAEKIQKLSLASSLIITRTLLSPVVPVTHFIADKAAKSLDWAHAPKVISKVIRASDLKVSSTYENITNDDKVLHLINTYCVY